jgi:hypothetical protein
MPKKVWELECQQERDPINLSSLYEIRVLNNLWGKGVINILYTILLLHFGSTHTYVSLLLIKICKDLKLKIFATQYIFEVIIEGW